MNISLDNVRSARIMLVIMGVLLLFWFCGPLNAEARGWGDSGEPPGNTEGSRGTGGGGSGSSGGNAGGAEANANRHSTFGAAQAEANAVRDAINASYGYERFNSTAVRGNPTDGYYGVATNEFGGNWEGGTSVGGAFTPCTSDPNIIPEDIYFVRPGTDAAIAQDQLIEGNMYEPMVQVRNTGCLSTGETDKYQTQLPQGENGSFPVGLTIDFDADGTTDISLQQYRVGPLAAGARTTVRFPAQEFSTVGAHSVTVTADLTASTSAEHGCAGTWGCVQESNETDNSRTEDFSVLRPSVVLGSVLVYRNLMFRDSGGDQHFSTITQDANTGSSRDITNIYPTIIRPSNPVQVGLFWEGIAVDLSTCQGSGISTAGNTLTDFSGRTDMTGAASTVSGVRGRGYNTDIDITEPVPGTNHIYTIICPTADGRGTVSDFHIIINGGPVIDPDTIVQLTPTLSNIPARTNQAIREIPFMVRNLQEVTVTGATYTLQVDGRDFSSGAIAGELAGNSSHTIIAEGTFITPTATGTIPMRLCVTHTDMSGERCVEADIVVRAPQCDDGVDNDGDGLLDENDPGCWTDINDQGTYDRDDDSEDSISLPEPTVRFEVNPYLIRPGTRARIEYEIIADYNVTCTLEGPGLAGQTILHTPGTSTGEVFSTVIENRQRFTITCVPDDGVTTPTTVTTEAEVTPRVFEI